VSKLQDTRWSNPRLNLVSEKLFWLSCQARTDVGLGHLSRCIALAEELNSRGYETCFAHFSELDVRGQSLLLNSDLSLTCECTGIPVAVICDSYDLNFISRIDLGTNSKLVLLADDVSLPFKADGYIEASPVKDWVPLNEKAPIFRFDANPILRRQFDASTISFDFDTPFDLLMTFGAGKELESIMNSLIPIIEGSSLFTRKVTLLSGEDLNSIDLAQSDKVEIEILRGTYNLRDLISNKTFVISAAGVTAWELITLGVPGYLIAVAENQYEQLDYFNRLGLREGIVYRNPSQLATEVNRLVESNNFIDAAKQAKSLIGSGRVESINWLLEKVLNYPNHQV
jgi:spore coat polysaccharide biosynthesis predicted glycosyltransferase SpsG